jgi:tetratricopeptide (TPR) repeat protein
MIPPGTRRNPHAQAQDTMNATEPRAQARTAVTLLSKVLNQDDPATLNRAVELLRSALAGTAGQRVPPGWLSNLGVALRIRYVRQGFPGDLDEAIKLGRFAVRGDHSQRPWHLANLAAALRLRALRSAAMADLDEAIEINRTVAATVPADDPPCGDLMSNLALTLQTRFARTGVLADLDQAVEAARAAVRMMPAGDPARAVKLANLSSTLRQRYLCTGAIRDIDAAVRAAGGRWPNARAASPTAPRSSTSRPQPCAGGSTAAGIWRTSISPSDLDTAIASWHEAAGTVSAASLTRLESATSSASATAKAGGLPVAVSAYATAVSLLPLVAWRGIARADQEFHLRTAGAPLGPDSAAAAVAGGRHEFAIELLEAGRSVRWAQLLEIRSDLRSLERAAPALASALRNCSTRLDEQLEDFPARVLRRQTGAVG